jgi:hypothetical protein
VPKNYSIFCNKNITSPAPRKLGDAQIFLDKRDASHISQKSKHAVNWLRYSLGNG